jgi:hypothetical protein
MRNDIAEILEIKDVAEFLTMMQENFEARIGEKRFFRITATPVSLGNVSANLEDKRILELLENPPNPHSRFAGWDVKPLPPLKRNALGFENERIDFHHVKLVKNGHLEFWTAIDRSFCWQQAEKEMEIHPRLYPYAVVEHPVSFVRQYRTLVDLLGVQGEILFQMQYLNVRGAILIPYRPDSIGFMAPLERVTPLRKDRLVFERKRRQPDFDPDSTALEIILDLYYEFGYSREQVPFFDEHGQCEL